MLVNTEYFFFWNGVFSQWYPCEFSIENRLFNCAEQYMMFKKALLFSDEVVAYKIMSAKHPKEQKALGRKIKNFNEALWTQKREQIVYEGNYEKFSQNPKLFDKLLETTPLILVEASPVDNIWGVGMAEDNLLITDPTNWQGLNLLGKVLTKLRDDLMRD